VRGFAWVLQHVLSEIMYLWLHHITAQAHFGRKSLAKSKGTPTLQVNMKINFWRMSLAIPMILFLFYDPWIAPGLHLDQFIKDASSENINLCSFMQCYAVLVRGFAWVLQHVLSEIIHLWSHLITANAHFWSTSLAKSKVTPMLQVHLEVNLWGTSAVKPMILW
jgi:hypothetical protein